MRAPVQVAKLFLKDETRFPTSRDVSAASGISSLLPGSSIQEYVFDPCGYSMNGLLQEAYWTIHITPESHCSYASFETNVRLNNYGPLVKAVLDIFRPKRYTMTLFADEQGLKQLKGGTAFPLLVAVPLLGAGQKPGVPTVLSADGSFEVAASAEGGGGSGGSGGSGSGAGASASESVSSYVQTHKSMSEFMGYSCFMGNYSLVCTMASSEGEETVAQAAAAALSAPRAKYILPIEMQQRVAGVRSRVRKESVGEA